MHTREALLRDATQIHDLIASYSGDGTLLPRTLPVARADEYAEDSQRAGL